MGDRDCANDSRLALVAFKYELTTKHSMPRGVGVVPTELKIDG